MRDLVFTNELEITAEGSLTTGKAANPGQVLSEVPGKERQSGSPGWGLDMELTPSPRKSQLSRNPGNREVMPRKRAEAPQMWKKQISCWGRISKVMVLWDVTRDPIRPYFARTVPVLWGSRGSVLGFYRSHKNSTSRTKILTSPAVGIPPGRRLVCGEVEWGVTLYAALSVYTSKIYCSPSLIKVQRVIFVS
jgi:hypothetical protein